MENIMLESFLQENDDPLFYYKLFYNQISIDESYLRVSKKWTLIAQEIAQLKNSTHINSLL